MAALLESAAIQKTHISAPSLSLTVRHRAQHVDKVQRLLLVPAMKVAIRASGMFLGTAIRGLLLPDPDGEPDRSYQANQD